MPVMLPDNVKLSVSDPEAAVLPTCTPIVALDPTWALVFAAFAAIAI